jgi:putative ABC transport system permease protein
VRRILRSLLRSPSVAAAAVLALGLAIGSATLLFSVTDAVLLRPLSYQSPEQLVVVWETQVRRGKLDNVVSPGNFLHWREMAQSFEQLAAVSLTFRSALTGAGEPEDLPIQLVTAELFPTLGVAPLIGRTFTPDEDRPESHVVVISHRLWTRRFGRDPAVVGRVIRLGGDPTTVLGVMPPGFSVLDPEVDAWFPTGFTEESRTPSGRWLNVIGRLRPGIGLAKAQQDMTRVAAALTEKFPDANSEWGARVVPLHDQMTGSVRPALLMLVGAVAFVVLIACANVANLLLARGASRRRELAVRTALGASRWALVRQQLAESVVLAAAGGLIGWFLAAAGLHLVRVTAEEAGALPRIDEVALDLRVLLFATMMVAVTAVLAGLLPSLAASRGEVSGALHDGGRGATGIRGARIRRGLVAVEVALALVLLAGAGLLIRSLIRFVDVDPGFHSEGVLTARVGLSGDQYDTPESRTAFFEALLGRLGALPGVEAAGGVSFLPMTGLGAATSFRVAGRPEPPPGREPVTDVRVISGDYFAALGIPLLEGRLFQPTDSADAAHVVIISETLARDLFPNEDPIGRELIISWGDDAPDRIIGVVGDIKHTGLDAVLRPMTYWPHARVTYPWLTLTLKTRGDPRALVAPLVGQVRSLDATLPISDIRTMADVVARTVAPRRLVMALLLGFAAVALLLAALGLYAVISYSVAERRGEMAIRQALGADRGRILRLVLSQAMMTTGAGMIAGLVGAVALSRVMEGLLFETAPLDPLAILGAVALLAAVGLLASWIPGRAAAMVDPITALHSE